MKKFNIKIIDNKEYNEFYVRIKNILSMNYINDIWKYLKNIILINYIKGY